MALIRDRYVVLGLAVLLVFVSIVAVAHAYTHNTNGVQHGLVEGGVPGAVTTPVGSGYAFAAVRHYSQDGTFNTQCEVQGWGHQYCNWNTSWGSFPCWKRSVNGVEGQLSRHWVRLSGCSGSLHS